jgi:hypothetical protein
MSGQHPATGQTRGYVSTMDLWLSSTWFATELCSQARVHSQPHPHQPQLKLLTASLPTLHEALTPAVSQMHPT